MYRSLTGHSMRIIDESKSEIINKDLINEFMDPITLEIMNKPVAIDDDSMSNIYYCTNHMEKFINCKFSYCYFIDCNGKILCDNCSFSNDSVIYKCHNPYIKLEKCSVSDSTLLL